MADLTRHEQFLNHIAHPDEPAPAPQTREEFLLKEIADNKGGGLPDYSDANDGDVLSIDSNGDPAWAQPSGGGGGILYVTLSWDDNAGADGGYVLDKTYAEIHEAVASNIPVYIWGEDYGNAVLEGFSPDILTGTVRFSFFNVASLGGNPVKYGLFVASFVLDNNNTLTLSEYDVQLTES